MASDWDLPDFAMAVSCRNVHRPSADGTTAAQPPPSEGAFPLPEKLAILFICAVRCDGEHLSLPAPGLDMALFIRGLIVSEFVLVAFVIGLGGVQVEAVAAGDTVAVTIDRTDKSGDRSFWNDAYHAAQQRDWGTVAAMISPSQRVWWSSIAERNAKGIDVSAPIRMMFPGEVNIENSLVVSYSDPDGNRLCRIYSEERRDPWIRGIAREGVRRHYIATIISRSASPRSIECDRSQPEPFGLGMSVDGIRLDVSPKVADVSTIDKVQLNIKFTNVTAATVVALPSRPTFALQSTLNLGIHEDNNATAYVSFKTWYKHILMTFPIEHFPLAWASRVEHIPVLIEPGESLAFDLRLSDLLSGAVDGPVTEVAGTLRLYLVYDGNLDPNPFKGAVPAWRHCIASNSFEITVGPKKEKE